MQSLVYVPNFSFESQCFSPPGEQFKSISTISELCTMHPPKGVNASMKGIKDRPKKEAFVVFISAITMHERVLQSLKVDII